MSLSHLKVIFDSPLVRVTDIVCRHPRGGCGCERGGERTHLTLLRRGGFGYHVHGEVHVGDPAVALLHRAGDSYRISHPFDGGDECSGFEVASEHEEELFGRRVARRADISHPVTPRDQFRHHALHAALRHGGHDALWIEETAAALCGSILRGTVDTGGAKELSPAAWRLARRAQEALLADPADGAGLAALAAQVGCSPFHLARVFRRARGISLADYRMHLRITMALGRLAQGAHNLAELACDLGFSHHSHFSAAFHRCVGMTPSAARGQLARLPRHG
jgi:AraC family transcriptional regulator